MRDIKLQPATAHGARKTQHHGRLSRTRSSCRQTEHLIELIGRQTRPKLCKRAEILWAVTRGATYPIINVSSRAGHLEHIFISKTNILGRGNAL